jgi:rubrerythrin
MSSVAATPDVNNLNALVFQYTVEAYKTFEKLAEMLQNPMSAAMFKGFAQDERNHRDLLEIKYARAGTPRMKITLGGDLRFQDMLEGDLSYRELAETLIGREKTIERKLEDAARSASSEDRNLLKYIAAGKRAHVALLERELDLIRFYPDWFKREDAESLVVLGEPES